MPVSSDTGGNTSSDSSTHPHGASEMNGSQKVANETHRAMKSRHLTMIGMYPSYSSTFGLNLLSPSYWWYHRDRNILECRNRASIELTFILLHEVDVYRVNLKAVSTGGPASALLSYCVLGVFVYGVVISL